MSKKIIAWLPAWAAYWTGDLVSRILNLFGNNETKIEKIMVKILYPVYDSCMRYSLYLSDWADLGIWVECDDTMEE